MLGFFMAFLDCAFKTGVTMPTHDQIKTEIAFYTNADL